MQETSWRLTADNQSKNSSLNQILGVPKFVGSNKPTKKSSSLKALNNFHDNMRDVVYHTGVARAATFLQLIGDDKIVQHHDTIGSCVERRLSAVEENKGFVAVDVGMIIKKWATFNATVGNHMKLALQADFTSDDTLAALFLLLGAKIQVDSISEVESVKRSIARSRSGFIESEYIQFNENMDTMSCESLFSHFVVDTDVNRTATSLHQSDINGNNVYFVDGINDIKLIAKNIADMSKVRFIVNVSNDVFDSSADHNSQDNAILLGCYLNTTNNCQSSVNKVIQYCKAKAFRCSGFNVDANILLDENNLLSLVELLSQLGQHKTLYVHSLTANMLDSVNHKHKLMQSLEFLHQQFPELHIVGEATDYILQSSHQLYTKIIASRPTIDRVSGDVVGQQLYVDDGIYGCLLHSNDTMNGQPGFTIGVEKDSKIRVIEQSNTPAPVSETMNTIIWGQTCDSIDKITENTQLPSHLQIGDWLQFTINYNISSITHFNGYHGAVKKYFINISNEVHGQHGVVTQQKVVVPQSVVRKSSTAAKQVHTMIQFPNVTFKTSSSPSVNANKKVFGVDNNKNHHHAITNNVVA